MACYSKLSIMAVIQKLYSQKLSINTAYGIWVQLRMPKWKCFKRGLKPLAH